MSIGGVAAPRRLESWTGRRWRLYTPRWLIFPAARPHKEGLFRRAHNFTAAVWCVPSSVPLRGIQKRLRAQRAGRRAAQKRVTGGRWRRIVLGHVLAEQVAGVLAAAALLGMPSGKIAHHPGWKPLQGSADDHVPGWLQARAGSPDPFR
eukprot:scaffold80036_cov61-Phaeocystis_antarctica.AAC.2